MKKNIFILGLNEFNLKKLKSVQHSENYTFHSLLSYQEVNKPEHYNVSEMIDKAVNALEIFPESVDAIIGYIDFPVTTMLPILCTKFGLPTPSLESVLKCQHKYWSRVEQQQIIPDHIPEFRAFNPFSKDPLNQIDLAYPFWIKPVKAAGSYLGFRVDNEEDFNRGIRKIRDDLPRVGDAFNQILDYIDLPSDIAYVDGNFCIAEEIIGGRQCTLEGSVHQGAVYFHGAIDSIRYRGLPTFFRYQYPSSLPKKVQKRMEEITARFLNHINYDNASFNVEFYWNQKHDQIWLLEVNTRISQSHSDMFEKVDGASNHQVMVEIGLGQKPDLPHRSGSFKKAAKFFLRKFENAVVMRVPTATNLYQIAQRYPDTVVDLQVQRGVRLSDKLERESYSYEIAWIYLGAETQKELLEKYHQVVQELNFEFLDLSDESLSDVSDLNIEAT